MRVANHLSDSSIKYIIAAGDLYTAECIRIHISRSFPSFQLAASLFDASSIRNFRSYEQAAFIIADVSMPDGSAIEAFQSIGLEHPIIFFGAYDPQHYKTDGLNVAGFLLKPPARQEIEEIINDKLISIKISV